ncbi:MAG: pyruvate kinase [Bacilli bacterium]|nr:pyruvate kinase [Bacilli bacterium]
MKKTKIICSIGPATQSWDMFKKIVDAGMNVARINFSHATLEERKETEDLVERANTELGTNIAVLYDTKGPDLRTCNFENDYITLVEGKTIRIVNEDILGTSERITFNYRNVIANLSVGNVILLDDGLIRLEVISTEADGGVTCKILDGAEIKSRRGVNIPGVNLDIPFISEEDKEDIKYACDHDGDFLGISFVSTAQDIHDVRALLKEYGKPNMPIITKVETAKAIENLDDIIEATDAVMVARGDLGVEVPMQELPILQKTMIQKCREKGKVCIVATEMLASMYTSSRPTRAEVSDIANAVLDGTDAVMLSGETTIGKHPELAVKFMADICENTESYYDYDYEFESARKVDVTETIAKSVVDSARLLDVKVIVAATMSGYSAKKISNLKPDAFILAACPTHKVARSLALSWGVYTAEVPVYNSTDEVVTDAKAKAKEFMKLEENDIIVVTGGFPNNTAVKTTNFMKIEEI